MILIRDKKKWKICKLISATKYIAIESIGEMDRKIQIENMTKIVENLAELAYEIGGERFATIDIPSYELHLRDQIEKGGRADG